MTWGSIHKECDCPLDCSPGSGLFHCRSMSWKRMLAYVTGSDDEKLLLRNEYLVTENRLLRNQIRGGCGWAMARQSFIERLSRSVKQEDVYLQDYGDGLSARRGSAGGSKTTITSVPTKRWGTPRPRSSIIHPSHLAPSRPRGVGA